MSNYNYDPYSYGHPSPPQRPPSDLDAMMYQNNDNVNPLYHQYPSPLCPSSSFPSHHYYSDARSPPQQAHLYHSGPLEYPPECAPSYLYDSPSPSFCYQETQPPPPAVPVPDYAAPPPIFQQFDSFHYGSSSNYSGELVFPPPHSDEFLAAYGGYGSAQDSHPIHLQSHGFPVHISDSPQSLSSTTLSTYPLESMLNHVHLSEMNPPRLQSTLDSNQSSSFHGYYSHSISGSFSPQTSSCLSTTPFSWQQYDAGGLQNEDNFQVVTSQPLQASLQVLLLHGNLDITVYGARNLPNSEFLSKKFTDLVSRRKRLIDKLTGKLESQNTCITSDPYVVVSVSSAAIARTYVISNNENPDWNQHFNVPVAHYAAEIQFTVKESDVVGSKLIGTVKIPTEHIYGGLKVKGTYPVLGMNGKECKRGATLTLSVQYIPVKQLTMYHKGVNSGPECGGVPGTYFPLRMGCRVKLYQDAHVPNDYLPSLTMDGEVFYEHGQCWKDIYEAIEKAKKLIYITGWSVYHMVRLVRDSSDRYNWTLGQLLRFKSQEGVRVLLLIWDDPTSTSFLGYQKEGLMQTHGEETHSFFKHSSVHVLLCRRSAGKKLSWAKKQEAGFIYTHHQKTVLVDSDAENGSRKIIAFVGGLDLCGGRYDNPEHSLFRTLETLHKDDNHNPTFVANIGGPREPWHDLHCRIDGPAAYDVLKNFEERWLKATSKHQGINKLKKSHDDKLLDVRRISDIITMEQSGYLDDPDSWHVQIFRSIDSSSVKGFPKDPVEATSKNLVCGKNVLIDTSIHTAYVTAIRAAQHFIYIENQYFLGSSYHWAEHKDMGANNLIPMEIALKIANKIKANERFSAYIVVPMWPEGNPTRISTQRILYWQNKTMQMMYEVIYKALLEVGQENEYVPQDYLCFFCLGNREALDESSPFLNPTAADAPNVHAHKARRFMIYVHSKCMIVDDEYVIVGSANINQRSLEGTRDTEIAMGAYQPQHTWARKISAPRGQIYAYRMSLWAEHLGFIDERFTNPESIDCMNLVRTQGELNWQQYIADEVTEMNGRLIKYPVDVDRKGQVKPLRGHETFPDVGGNTCGSFLVGQENLTI